MKPTFATAANFGFGGTEPEFPVSRFVLVRLRAETCVARASECQFRAEGAGNSSARAEYLDLARRWRELASLVEELERQKAELDGK
jgi:hypothetical protein